MGITDKVLKGELRPNSWGSCFVTEVQTYSAKSKMIAGIVSLVLGLMLIMVGLVLYLKNGEGE